MKVGDFVLLKEDITPRLSRKKGIVDQFIYGKDGLIRGAIIRTKSKNSDKPVFIKRPLQLLVSLEVTPFEHNETLLEPANNEIRPKRLAALDADTIRKLTC